MYWWFKRGVDGFCMDVVSLVLWFGIGFDQDQINFIVKVFGLLDVLVIDLGWMYQLFGMMLINCLEVYGWLKEMNCVVFLYYDCFV